MSYINYTNFPPLPLDLEIDILATISNKSKNQNKDLLINTNDEMMKIIGTVNYNPITSIGYHYSEGKNIFPNLVDYDFIEPSQKVKDWIRSNIPLECVPYIQMMSNGNVVPPHVDESRSKAVNYLLETGGSASTTFYKPKHEYSNLEITPQIVIPYTRLDVVETAIIPERSWHELTVTSIHGVENLTARRIALTLCL